MIDNYRHKGMRRKLIEKLTQKGITNTNVLDAFEKVPRHFFLDTSFVDQAYSDIAFRIGAGQTISQPYTVAFQTSLLDCSHGDKVLEIGTGSGFQTSILCALGYKVYSIERQKELFVKAKSMIQQLNYFPKLFYGDGYKGKQSYAPYDAILVTCGAPFVPEALTQQLKIGGRLVIPVGEGRSQKMKRIIRKDKDEWREEDHGDFSFVPMLSDKSR